MTTSIESFVEERKIKYLFHFTRLNNLQSILKDGLLTKDKCAATNITPVINDLHRYDGTDAICVTISYPNYKLFYRLRCENPKDEWVVLKLGCSLLWRTRCAFSNTNAGDGAVYKIPLGDRQGLAPLQSMFGDYGSVERLTLKIPDHYTTNPQAEVLLLDGASVSDIKGVYFESSATQQKYSALYPDLQCHVKGGFFEGRSDSSNWKN